MKKQFFLFLIITLLKSIQIDENEFMRRITNQNKKEARLLKKRKNDLLKKKTLIKKYKSKSKKILRILKLDTQKKSKAQKILNKNKKLKSLKTEITSNPLLLQKYKKLLSLYKSLKKHKKRNLSELLTQNPTKLPNATGTMSILTFLTDEFAKDNKLVKTYLKPISTLYTFLSLRKANNDKIKMQMRTSRYGNLDYRFKTVRNLMKSDLEDIQVACMNLERVFNKVNSMNRDFNFRLSQKVEVLRKPL